MGTGLDQEELKELDSKELQELLESVAKRDPDQPEFLQAVTEVAASLQPVFKKRPELLPVFRRLCEPERQVMFRVAWLDDNNEIQINRGFRVQFSSAIGPYKGGLRFHPSVNLSIMKFLGFEQVFKNSLTTLAIGGGKGGSDFDPKGKSDGEIMRFCQSFMTELARHIGSSTDIPAGDIGVGSKEIGYLFGQFKRLTKEFVPVLTGKGLEWGGSFVRPEATGFGAVFFAEEVLKDKGESLEGKRCLVSGAGNVAQYCAELLVERGAKVLTLSDSKGFIFKKEGLTKEDVSEVMKIKGSHNGSLKDLSDGAIEYCEGKSHPWGLDVEVDMVFPCATQNEVGEEDAKELVKKGCKYVVEGANMPCTPEAAKLFASEGVTYCPGKAANAGGVAVSGLEIIQNRLGEAWEKDEVQERLQNIMQSIFQACKQAAEEYKVDLAAGANIAGFLKVAEAMLAQGAV
ncbi:hypothetical protein N2152v2_003522 [Parachlorella kessleri]